MRVTVVAAAADAALGFDSGPLVVSVLSAAVEPAMAVVVAVLVGMAVNVRIRPSPSSSLWRKLPGDRTAAVITSLAVAPAWSAVALAAVVLLAAGAGYSLESRGARRLAPRTQRRAVLLAVLTGADVALARAAI